MLLKKMLTTDRRLYREFFFLNAELSTAEREALSFTVHRCSYERIRVQLNTVFTEVKPKFSRLSRDDRGAMSGVFGAFSLNRCRNSYVSFAMYFQSLLSYI